MSIDVLLLAFIETVLARGGQLFRFGQYARALDQIRRRLGTSGRRASGVVSNVFRGAYSR